MVQVQQVDLVVEQDMDLLVQEVVEQEIHLQ